MKNRNNLIFYIGIIILVLGLVIGNYFIFFKTDETGKTSPDSSIEELPLERLDKPGLQLGVAWVGKSGMSDRVSQAMRDLLVEKAPEIRVEWYAELETSEELDTIARQFQRETDAMVLLRSTGARYLAENPPIIPSFVGGCNDPSKLGAVKDLWKPEGSITGVTYALRYKSVLDTFKTISPQMQSILLVYEINHPGAIIDRQGTELAAEELNLEYNEVGVNTKEERDKVMLEWKDDVSAIIIANNAVVFDETESIANQIDIPLFAYTHNPISEGVLAGFAADDAKLGRYLAESIIDILINNKSVSEVPVKFDEEPQIYVNLGTADKLGIEIPSSILESAVTFGGESA